jgi:hypothetical protein
MPFLFRQPAGFHGITDFFVIQPDRQPGPFLQHFPDIRPAVSFFTSFP